MKEAVHGSLEYDPQYTPAASDHKATKYEAEEEGDSPSIDSQSAESEQAELYCPAYEQREPEHSHRPAS